MKYMKYLSSVNSHFNQVILQWTSFSLEAIVLLMLQCKGIGQFLINKFQNVLSRTCKQNITLKNTATWMTEYLGCRTVMSMPAELELKAWSFLSCLQQDPPGITAEVDCQWEFSCFLLMSSLLISICIIQIDDNRVRGFPPVVATIWIDWRVFREERKEWER